MSLKNIAEWTEGTAAGTSCGADDKPAACGAADEKPAACGAADEKPAACGSACGASDK